METLEAKKEEIAEEKEIAKEEAIAKEDEIAEEKAEETTTESAAASS
jgi:hypothetical protein